MSILSREDRKDLVYSCRKALLDHVDSSGILTESTRAAARHFILNEASYQDLLNLVYNPNRDTEYLDTEVLESVALESYARVLNESLAPESVFGLVEESVNDTLKAAGKALRSWGSSKQAAETVKKATRGKTKQAAETVKKATRGKTKQAAETVKKATRGKTKQAAETVKKSAPKPKPKPKARPRVPKAVRDAEEARHQANITRMSPEYKPNWRERRVTRGVERAHRVEMGKGSRTDRFIDNISGDRLERAVASGDPEAIRAARLATWGTRGGVAAGTVGLGVGGYAGGRAIARRRRARQQEENNY
jgi:hypothetical protein